MRINFWSRFVNFSLKNLNLLVAVLCSAVVGALSLWQLWEQDIFWQIRAGEQLWQTAKFIAQDSWSFTAYGEPWYDTQWLANLLFRLVYGFLQERGLVLLRGFLVMGLFLGVARLIWRSLTTKKFFLPLCCIISPLTFIALFPRLQIRPELLVMVLFTWLLVIWLEDLSFKTKLFSSYLAVLLSSNLHMGVSPFVLVLAIYLLLVSEERPSWLAKLRSLLILDLLIFVNPYTYKPLGIIFRHLFNYHQHKAMANPDHEALQLKHLSVAVSGYFAWVALGILVSSLLWYGYAKLVFLTDKRNLIPLLYRKSLYFAGLVLLLFWISVDRVRAFPYLVLFLLPLLVSALEGLSNLLSSAKNFSKFYPAHILLGLWLCLACSLGFWQVKHHNLTDYGLRLKERFFPEGSTRFIKQQNLAGNLFNTFSYGNYLLWYLKDHLVFGDTREYLYWHLEDEVLRAYYSPQDTLNMYAKYDINTSLVPIPKTAYIPGYGFRDIIREYLPIENWALVYFDDVSIVMLRRLKEHEQLIKEHEYKFLRPNLPPQHYLESKERTPANDALFLQELSRCLHDEPQNLFCNVVKSQVGQLTTNS